MDLHTLKTPSLILDVARVRHNAEQMSRRAKQFDVDLRPHVKTHKCLEVARIQTSGNSGAVTVSTLAEARAFALHGFTHITYAVPIEPGKFEEAIEISKNCEDLSLITDDVDVPGQLNDIVKKEDVKLSVFLKVDCGYHRCGVEPTTPEALEIPGRITDASHLRFAGILTHAGHSYHCSSPAEVLRVAKEERDVMTNFAEHLRSEVGPVPIVSIGSTPTITSVDHLEGVDEVRPGNYIFFDAFQATLGTCDVNDCALTVLASVVHRDAARQKVIIDAGAIALSKDRGPVELDPKCGYGKILNLEGNDFKVTVDSMSQEHGVIFTEDQSVFDCLKIGTRVRVLENHSCLTAGQHSYYNVLEGERIVDRWQIHTGW